MAVEAKTSRTRIVSQGQLGPLMLCSKVIMTLFVCVFTSFTKCSGCAEVRASETENILLLKVHWVQVCILSMCGHVYACRSLFKGLFDHVTPLFLHVSLLATTAFPAFSTRAALQGHVPSYVSSLASCHVTAHDLRSSSNNTLYH